MTAEEMRALRDKIVAALQRDRDLGMVEAIQGEDNAIGLEVDGQDVFLTIDPA